LRYDVEHPGQLELMPAPIPTWDGVEYVDSAALPTFRTGDGNGPTGAVSGVDLMETPGATATQFNFLAAALSGVAPYEYRFWVKDPVTGWAVKQAYSLSNAYTFDTAGLATGTYVIQVDARSAGSTANREAATVLAHEIAGPAATSVDLAESAGANPGEFVYTGSASGGTGPYEYRFWLKDPVAGWAIKQAYSATPSWTLDTTGLGAGTYVIQVDAHSQGSSVKVSKVLAHVVAGTPATAVTLSEAAGGNPGEFVYTAAASGGVAPYEYRFWLKDPVTGWALQQGYSTSDNWTLSTGALASGLYVIQVDTRSAGSSANRESSNVVTHLVGITQASAVSLAGAAGNPGELIYTAVASGGTAPYEYRFWLKDPVTGWALQQGYSTSDNWTLATGGLASGQYGIQVDARAQGTTTKVSNVLSLTIP